LRTSGHHWGRFGFSLLDFGQCGGYPAGHGPGGDFALRHSAGAGYMSKYLIRGHEHDVKKHSLASRNPFVLWQVRFEKRFEKLRNMYHGILERVLHNRRVFVALFLAGCLGSLVLLLPWLGQDFFPTVDSGTFKLHMRGPTGLRIEETARVCDLVERSIRKQLPPGAVASVIDNIGLPYSGLNLSYSSSAPVGNSDADILVTLNEKSHVTDKYVHDLRIGLAS